MRRRKTLAALQKLIAACNAESGLHIASAAATTEEIGNPVYPPARKKLAEYGIDSMPCG